MRAQVARARAVAYADRVQGYATSSLPSSRSASPVRERGRRPVSAPRWPARGPSADRQNPGRSLHRDASPWPPEPTGFDANASRRNQATPDRAQPQVAFEFFQNPSSPRKGAGSADAEVPPTPVLQTHVSLTALMAGASLGGPGQPPRVDYRQVSLWGR